MKEDINIKVNKIFKIVFSALTLIVGCLFLWQTADIYFTGKEVGEQIYTYKTIGKHFGSIAIPTIIWIVGIIVGIVFHFVFPLPKEKLTAKKEYERLFRIYNSKFDVSSIEDKKALDILNKEKLRRLICKIVLGVILLICTVMTCCFVFNFSNYSKDGNLIKEMVNITVHILPWLLISFGFGVGYLYIVEMSYKMSFETIKGAKLEKKENVLKEASFIVKHGVLITRILVLTVAVVFIVIGIVNKDYVDVLHKAKNICTECIGLG